MLVSEVILDAAAEAAVPDPDAIRRALLESVGGRRDWTPKAPA